MVLYLASIPQSQNTQTYKLEQLQHMVDLIGWR